MTFKLGKLDFDSLICSLVHLGIKGGVAVLHSPHISEVLGSVPELGITDE